jgi:hypothetical protein
MKGRGRAAFLKIIVVMILTLPPACQATTITIGFTSTVDEVDDPCNLLGSGVLQNDSISGFYIYDSETSDSTQELIYNGLYKYSTTPYGMSMTIGEITFQTNTADVDFMINIWNDSDVIPKDRYRVTSYNNLPLNGLTIGKMSWFLDDSSGDAISSIELPEIPPDLLAWEDNLLLVDGWRGSESFEFSGHITDVWLIPEPVTFLLLGVGAVLLRRKH